MKDFINAISTGKKVTAYKLHFKLPDGRIGITAAHSSEEVLSDLQEEIESKGAKLIKREKVII